MKTYMANSETIKQKWLYIDATNKVLGRLASTIANLLHGKHKADFTPHCDTGDFVVVTNVEKLRVTGRKTNQKMYYNYSGYPSGMRVESFRDLQHRAPERVLEIAVRGMLPKGPLGRKMLKKLKIYKGNEHPHQTQKPVIYELE